MADKCKNCIHYNRQSNNIELPDGNFIEQQGFVPNVGTGGEEIAKCSNNANTWENITRDASTESFFDSIEKRKVMEYVGALGVGENDFCPLFSPILVSEIIVTSTGDVDFVGVGKDIKLFANALPINAVDTSVTWSVVNGTGTASVDVNGLVTGITEGTVTVVATANDGSGVFGEFELNVVVLVSTIIVSGFGGATTVLNGANLQMVAVISPINATNQVILWSVANGTGAAAIDQFSGVLTGGALGTVTVTATATDGSGVFDTFDITVI